MQKIAFHALLTAPLLLCSDCSLLSALCSLIRDDPFRLFASWFVQGVCSKSILSRDDLRAKGGEQIGEFRVLCWAWWARAWS